MHISNSWSPSRIAIQRAARRRSTHYLFLNLWPFVGVLIVLLVVFMTETPQRRLWWFPVALPMAFHSVSQPHAIREDSIRISIMRDGQVYLHTTRILTKDLGGAIRDAVKDGAEKKAYLAVDGRAMYRDVDVVVDQIHLAGISEICFITAFRTP
jgi:biopolymer transport protein ExbD